MSDDVLMTDTYNLSVVAGMSAGTLLRARKLQSMDVP